MDARRRRILHALGITPWVRRHRPSRQAAIGDAVAQSGASTQGSSQRALLNRDPVQPRPAAQAGATPPAAAGESAPSPELLTPPPGEAESTDDITRLDWDELARRVAQCHACDLAETRTQTVFGVGARDADAMIVGEAPGADEDRQGEPFVGRAGKLLDAMLAAIDLSRQKNCYIANILKCRPPNNRDPRPEEVAACFPYLARQIELVAPRAILAVGRIAAQNLLQVTTPIGKLRGRIHRYGPSDIPVVVTYHPAYLLRSPLEKRKAWEDLKLYRRLLQEG